MAGGATLQRTTDLAPNQRIGASKECRGYFKRLDVAGNEERGTEGQRDQTNKTMSLTKQQ
jgi:hypothetical protein